MSIGGCEALLLQLQFHLLCPCELLAVEATSIRPAAGTRVYNVCLEQEALGLFHKSWTAVGAREASARAGGKTHLQSVMAILSQG